MFVKVLLLLSINFLFGFDAEARTCMDLFYTSSKDKQSFVKHMQDQFDTVTHHTFLRYSQDYGFGAVEQLRRLLRSSRFEVVMPNDLNFYEMHINQTLNAVLKIKGQLSKPAPFQLENVPHYKYQYEVLYAPGKYHLITVLYNPLKQDLVYYKVGSFEPF